MTLPRTPGSWSPEHLAEALGQVRTVVAVVGPRPREDRPFLRSLRQVAFSAALTVGSFGVVQQAIPTVSVALGLGGLATQEASAHIAPADSAFHDLLARPAWEPAPPISMVPPLSAQEEAWQAIMAEAPSDPHDWPGVLHAHGEDFLALAAVMENFEREPYLDPGGLNVGYGYCITRRVAELGEDRVRLDLQDAGFSSDNIELLLTKPREAVKTIKVEPLQALRLLWQTQEDYRTIARDTLGDTSFDTLPGHRQATLTWLAYNTGEGFGQFRRLREAVQDDNPAEAVRHLMPHYMDGGAFVPNRRAGALLMASFWSPEGLDQVINKTAEVMDAVQLGTSPVTFVDPEAKNAAPSPYPGMGQILAQRNAARAAQAAPTPEVPRPIQRKLG